MRSALTIYKKSIKEEHLKKLKMSSATIVKRKLHEFNLRLIATYKDEKDRENILTVAEFIESFDKIYGASLEQEGDENITVEFVIHRTVDVKNFMSKLSHPFIKDIEISVQELKEKGNRSQGHVVVLWIHFYKDQFMQTEKVEKRRVSEIEEEYKERMKKYKDRKKCVKIPKDLAEKISVSEARTIDNIVILLLYRDDRVDIPKSRFIIPHDINEPTKIRVHVPDSHFRVSFDFFRLIMSKFRGKIGHIIVDPMKSHIEIEVKTNAKRTLNERQEDRKRNKRYR